MQQYRNLGRPIVDPQGGQISTVEEALNFYFSLPARDRIERRWTEAAKLLLLTFEENDVAVLERAEKQFRFAIGGRTPRAFVPPHGVFF